MKVFYATLLMGISVTLGACNSTKDAKDQDVKTDSIIGRWKLEKEERRSTTEKGVEYANQPTYVILHVQKNGYFILYDTFIDPEWKKKNLPLISERSKGQWEVKNDLLTLHHSGDSTYTEVMSIAEIDDNKLVTKGQNKKSNIYKTYGK